MTLVRLDVIPSDDVDDITTGDSAIMVRPSSYGYEIGLPRHLSTCGTLSRVCNMLHSFSTELRLRFQLTLIAMFVLSSFADCLLLLAVVVEESDCILCVGLAENENTAPLPPL